MSDFRMVPLDELVQLSNDKVVGRKDPNIPYIGLEHIAQGEPILLGTTPSDSSISVNSVFQAGDILFGKLRPNLRKSVQARFDGYCSTDILVLRTNPGFLPEFIARVFQRVDVFAEAVRTAEGTKMPRTSWEKLRTFRVFVPELPEQRSISEILDTMDEAIEQTDAVITKLKSMKQGLLHDLLTRGLDEHGQLRDPVVYPERFKASDLGIIPNEWEVKKLNQVLNGIDAGKSPDCPDIPAASGEWGILKVSAVRPEGFKAEENKVVTNPAYVNGVYEIHEDDLLISRANTYELVGIVCLVQGSHHQLLLSDKTLRLNLNLMFVSKKFMFHMLQMPFVRTQIEIDATGSSGSMKNISQDTIRNLKIPLPSLEEQNRIIDLLTVHDNRIHAEEEYRDKLKLQKQGLMHDLLTGRVRVGASEAAVQ